MTAEVSRTFHALDALYTLWTGAFDADPTIYVLDGPPVSAIANGNTTLIVGGAGDPSQVMSAGGELIDAAMANGLRESFDVHCHIEYWQGGDDIRACREKVRATLNAAAAAIAADRSLDGAVTRARVLGSLELGQAHFKGDTGAALPFVVHCDVA
jgi:hypothetical protein